MLLLFVFREGDSSLYDSMFKRGARDYKESFLMLYEMDTLKAIQVSTSDRPKSYETTGFCFTLFAFQNSVILGFITQNMTSSSNRCYRSAASHLTSSMQLSQCSPTSGRDVRLPCTDSEFSLRL
jgi:hypothetical protein